MISAEQARSYAAKFAKEMEVQSLMDGPITEAITQAAESGDSSVILNLTPYYGLIPSILGKLSENGFKASVRMNSALVEVSW